MNSSLPKVLTARRSNGEVVYFCDSPTQGERMVPNAGDYAYRFCSVPSARKHIARLSDKWRGLTDWHVEQAVSVCARGQS